MTVKYKCVLELPQRRAEVRLAGPLLLTDVATRAGVFLNAACGGQGACGGCAVDLLAGKFHDLNGAEIALADGRPHRVLACKTRWLEGDPSLVTGYALLCLGYCRPAVEKAAEKN